MGSPWYQCRSAGVQSQSCWLHSALLGSHCRAELSRISRWYNPYRENSPVRGRTRKDFCNYQLFWKVWIESPLYKSCWPSAYNVRHHDDTTVYCRRCDHRHPQRCISSVSLQTLPDHCRYYSWRRTKLRVCCWNSLPPSQLNVDFPHRTAWWTFLKGQTDDFYFTLVVLSYRDHPCLVLERAGK